MMRRAAKLLRVLAMAACAMTLGAQAGMVQVAVADGAGVPLAHAVVTLLPLDERHPVKPWPGAEMAQAGRKFLPEVLVVPVGTPVRFPNRDTVRHHVYSFSPAKKFEIKLYVGTPAQPVVFDRPGVVVLGCNIHDEMVGWIVAVDTPHFGLSPEGGAPVQIADVPPGRYTLRVWHPRLPSATPPLEQPLTVPGAAPVSISVALKGLDS